jgi:Flp pilus assembly protein TadG
MVGLIKTRKFCSLFLRDKSGIAATEFAILAPVLIMLFAGIMNFGYVIYTKHTMQNIAGDTLRSVIYGNVKNNKAKREAKRKLNKLHGSFKIAISENTKTEDVTVTIVADAKASTLMPVPFVSADLLTGEFKVDVTSPRIAQFNPAKL